MYLEVYKDERTPIIVESNEVHVILRSAALDVELARIGRELV